VRRTDARSRERNRPKGVTQGFQVSLYKVDPRLCVLARNLFSKDDCRAALLDEPVEVGPKVPLVIKPSSFACRAERLARTRSCPDGVAVWHSGAAQGVAPDADSSEEVALTVSSKVIWCHVLDASGINVAGGDVAGGDEVAQ